MQLEVASRVAVAAAKSPRQIRRAVEDDPTTSLTPPMNCREPAAVIARSAASLRELISWLWVALAFLLITGTMVQARVIPSGSMENTLLVGDHLLMSRLGYDAGVPFTRYHVRLWREPHRQQMIIFHAPIPGTDEDYIKRLIGMPGDRVEIRGGVVSINGTAARRALPQRPAEPAR